MPGAFFGPVSSGAKHVKRLPSAFRQKFFRAPGFLLSPIWSRATSLHDGFQVASFARAAAAARSSASRPLIMAVASSTSLLVAALLFTTPLKHAAKIATAEIATNTTTHRAFDFICPL